MKTKVPRLIIYRENFEMFNSFYLFVIRRREKNRIIFFFSCIIYILRSEIYAILKKLKRYNKLITVFKIIVRVF